MNKFIVFTGLDGSGTSTMAKELHIKDEKSILIDSLPEPFLSCRSLFDKTLRLENPTAHFLFYLSANVYTSHKVNELLNKGYNVYCARYFIDTIVSHRVLGLQLDYSYKTNYFDIIQPDFIICLTINEELRQKRMANRKKSDLDRVLDDKFIRNKFLLEFEKLKNHLIFIDNSTEIKETVNKIQLACGI